MKKSFQFLSLVFALICGVTLLSACSLEHYHYTDDYGVCKSCGEDTAELIRCNANKEYISTERYFKFVAQGEEFITIIAEELGASIDYIILYTKDTNSLYLSHVSGTDSYFHSSQLENDKTYYIKVRVRVAGKVKLTVSPYIES
ncbi:MAG: hypothetical protein IJ415_01085 [Clostridia bacterium]|nr:hypothetical protein [Clostridia bacterium]